MLTGLQLDSLQWAAVARKASWQTTRMNLATFARHGVFEQQGLTELIAARLRDAEQIRRARVLPYQLMAAWTAAAGLPAAVREALQDAMEIALENVPAFVSGAGPAGSAGRVFVLPDVSGSMSSPITGHRGGGTSAVRCIDVAGGLRFAERVREAGLNPRDTVLTNAAKLAALGGGGTNCSAPLEQLNRERAQGDLVVFISDNQSWMGTSRARTTGTLWEWDRFRERNPRAKLVCIDLQPYANTQAIERADILNVGGFSDAVFERVAEFAQTDAGPDGWVRSVDQIEL